MSQRPLTLILLLKYRDTNGRRIVIRIGGVCTTFCQEEGILSQKYRDRNGRCIAILFKSISVRGRCDSPEYILLWRSIFSTEKPKRVVSKRVVLADIPPERRYVRMFPGTKNRNEGTFACSPGTKSGTRVNSPKPAFYETALLSPGFTP